MSPHILHPALAGVVTLIVGIYPYWQRPNKLTKLFALSNVFLVICNSSDFLALVPISHAARLFGDRMSYVALMLTTWFFFRFTMEFSRIPLTQFRRLWNGLLVAGGLFVLIAPTSFLIRDLNESPGSFIEIPGPGLPLFFLFSFGALLLAIYRMVRQYRKTTKAHQNQIRYLALAFSFSMTEYGLYFIGLYFPSMPYFYFYLQVIYTGIVAYAILSQQLMDIRVVIRQTLVYTLTSIVLTSISLFIMVLMTRFTLGSFTPRLVVSAALSAIAITLLFHPLIQRAQNMMNRLFFRERLDRQAKVAAFSATITGQQSVDEMTLTFCGIIDEAFHPKTWALYRRPMGEGVFSAEHQSGDFPLTVPLNNAWSQFFATHPGSIMEASDPRTNPENSPSVRVAVPLQASNDLLGYLLLGEKRSDQPYIDEDMELLRILANQAAVVYERPKLLREVSGGFVHEIKIPLTNIVLPAELCLLELAQTNEGELTRGDFDKKLKQRLRFIIDQALLAAHRLEAMQQINELQAPINTSIRPCQLIEKSLAGLVQQIETSGVQIDVLAQGNLPLIRGDSGQLEIVLVNLIKNALEAMAACAPEKRRITISADAHESSIRLRISDNGPGIVTGDLETIFKASMTTKGASHRGLGLFLARRIVQIHKGTIAVESHLGDGTAFSIELPQFT